MGGGTVSALVAGVFWLLGLGVIRAVAVTTSGGCRRSFGLQEPFVTSNVNFL
jgi:hypothetical protein